MAVNARFSPQFGIQIVPTTQPGWLAGQAPAQWQWININGTAQSGSAAMQTMQASRTLLFNEISPGGLGRFPYNPSMVFRQSDCLLLTLASGGHEGYAGNEVPSIRLSDNNPAWSVLRQPTPNSSIDVTGVAYNTDGRPTASQTYRAQWWVQSRSRAMRFYCNAPFHFPGVGFANIDGFNLATNDWDPANTWGLNPIGGGAGAQDTLGLLDERTDIFYTQNAGSSTTLNIGDCKTNPITWSTRSVGSAIPGTLGVVGCIDTLRNRIVCLTTTSNPLDLRTLSLSSGSWVSQTPPSNPAIPQSIEAPGFEYEPVLDKYLIYFGGQQIYLLDPVAWTLTLAPLLGITPPGGLIFENVNGIGTRFRYSSLLGGCVFLGAFTSNICFVRTH